MTTLSPYAPQREDYLARLRKIEGQVRGLQRMVGEDGNCIDVVPRSRR